jgi:RING finger/CHY zinc finger protein 1
VSEDHFCFNFYHITIQHLFRFVVAALVFLSTNVCFSCGVTFAEWHCPKCNLWMDLKKRPFHCDKCGICRVGGQDKFRHCEQCCMCIAVVAMDTHNCIKDKYKSEFREVILYFLWLDMLSRFFGCFTFYKGNCPVCREDMFSSRQSPQDLPCGHAIHVRFVNFGLMQV